MTREEPRVSGIIGIRLGSKGVPNKNIRCLSGVPLVAWVFDAAKKSITINKIVLSTGSREYAGVVQK